jgi:hypothetical protein
VYAGILAQLIDPRVRSFGATAVGAAMAGTWPSHAMVGVTVYHSVGDRQAAMKDLALAFDQLYGELNRQIFHATIEHPYGLASDTTIRMDWKIFWDTVASPVFNAWRDFKAERSAENWTHGGSYIAYGEQFRTDWSEYEKWYDRLTDLRSRAQQIGIPLNTPEPKKLEQTIWAKAEEVASDLYEAAKRTAKGAAKGAGEAWDIAKYGVIGALVIGGIVALSSVATNVRKGRDPAERWIEYAGRGARRGAQVAAL